MTSNATWVDQRFPAMRSYDYRRLFVNGFFTTGSRWAQVLGRGWLVHELSGGSSAAVGWVTFASFLPFIVVAPVAGVLADRIDRRRLLIGATLFGVASALGLTVITVAGVVEVWHVVFLAFLAGSAQAATVPARQSLAVNVVPSNHMINAVRAGRDLTARFARDWTASRRRAARDAGCWFGVRPLRAAASDRTR